MNTESGVGANTEASGTPLTDVLATKLCAQAMGYQTLVSNDGPPITVWPKDSQAGLSYHPLKDDAQAMELVKKFELEIFRSTDADLWDVMSDHLALSCVEVTAARQNLNGAIVECVAKMQVDRMARETAAMGKAK